MRKIGFDFDGVLAEKVSFDGDIEKYRRNLLNAKPLLNPFRIKRSDDKIYIVTGRYTEHYYHTIKWLTKHYPRFGFNNLYFANELELKDKYYKNLSKYILYISKMKLIIIKELDLDIYFEDDKFTINFLKKHIGRKCKIIDIKDVSFIDFNQWIKQFNTTDKNIKITKLKDLKNVKDINHIKFLKELN